LAASIQFVGAFEAEDAAEVGVGAAAIRARPCVFSIENR
jgi:hypothetical protein